MKRIFILLSLLIPIIVFAQTKEDNWVNLYNYMEDKYERDFMVGYKPKGGEYNDVVYVTKIAFKKNGNANNSELYLLPVVIDGNKAKFSLEPIAITGNFEFFKSNGTTYEKFSPNIIKGKSGWSIYELESPAAILKINTQGSDWDITSFFNSIKITLDPSLDLMAMFDESNKEAQKEFDNNLYTTPQNMGWTPFKTETLSDGTKVEYYGEGVRYFQKPNGDFASFKENPDKRDEITLDIVKGIDQPITERSSLIGAFKITRPDSVTIIGDGNTVDITFKNNKNINLDFIDKTKETEQMDRYSRISAFFPNSKIHYSDFITIGKFLFDNPHDFDVNKIISNSYIKSNLCNSNNTPTPLKALNIKLNYHDYTKEALQWDYVYIPCLTDYKYLFEIKNGELQIVGIVIQPEEKDYIGESDILFIPQEITLINESDKNTGYYKKEIKFANGDYINFQANNKVLSTSINLPDGTKIEKFPDNDNFRFTFKNGDRYVGSLYDFNGLWNGQYEKSYNDGTLTTNDGHQLVYSAGKSDIEWAQRAKEKEEQEEAQKKAVQELLNKLSAKYGKANVESAAMGNIKNGMKFQMLKELGLTLIEDDQVGNDTWYKWVTDITYHGDVKYKWIRVNNKTGLVNYVGAASNRRPLL